MVACKSSVDIMSHVFIQALLSSTIQDRSSMLEAHMVSANSRYIEEQQEQQQVDRQSITTLSLYLEVQVKVRQLS